MGDPYYCLFENTGTFQEQYPFWETGKKNYLGWINTRANPDANTELSLDIAYRGGEGNEDQYLIAKDIQIVNPQSGSSGSTQGYYARGRYLINARDSAEIDPVAYLWNTVWPRLVFTDAIHANNALYILGGVNLAAEDILLAVDGQPVVDVLKLDGLAEAGKIHKVTLDNSRPKNCTFVFQPMEEGITDCFIASGENGWIRIRNMIPVISPELETDIGFVFSISPVNQ
jgi:hypothetical protein